MRSLPPCVCSPMYPRGFWRAIVGGSPLREAIFGIELSNWLMISPSIRTVYCWPIVRISIVCQTPLVWRLYVPDCLEFRLRKPYTEPVLIGSVEGESPPPFNDSLIWISWPQ